MNIIKNKENEDFKNLNYGILKIQAFTAYHSVPLENVKVRVSCKINNEIKNFFNGITNQDGVIDNIKLPAPSIENEFQNKPNYIVYDIEAKHEKYKTTKLYKAEIYAGIKSIQYIKMTPNGSAINE